MSGARNAMASRERTAAAIAEIRAEIERRSKLSSGIERRGLERSLTEARRHATINAHWGITPSWPVLGRFEVLAKRVMRILLRWYINPLVEQQNTFNLSVLAALYEMEAHLEAISREQKQDDIDTTRNEAR